jgi:hypothetical protein
MTNATADVTLGCLWDPISGRDRDRGAHRRQPASGWPEIGPTWGHLIVYTFLADSAQLGVYHHLDHRVSATGACLGTLQVELAPFGAHGRRLP